MTSRNGPRLENYRRTPLAMALGILLAACAGGREPPPQSVNTPEGSTSLTLLPVTAYPRDFQWQQRVTAEWEGGRRSFSAVLSKAGGTLRLLGLDPMGRVGFSLTLNEGQDVEFRTHASIEFPFDPRRILQDVQRIYFPLFQHGPGEDGVRTGKVQQLWVKEAWTGGLLKSRSFSDLHTRATVADVTYTHRQDLGDVPEEAHYRNLRYRYRLHVRTLAVSDL